MKLTPWIKARINPVRKGYYEVAYAGDDPYGTLLYWTGREWRFRPDYVVGVCSFGKIRGDKWRGVKKDNQP